MVFWETRFSTQWLGILLLLHEIPAQERINLLRLRSPASEVTQVLPGKGGMNSQGAECQELLCWSQCGWAASCSFQSQDPLEPSQVRAYKTHLGYLLLIHPEPQACQVHISVWPGEWVFWILAGTHLRQWGVLEITGKGKGGWRRIDFALGLVGSPWESHPLKLDGV